MTDHDRPSLTQLGHDTDHPNVLAQLWVPQTQPVEHKLPLEKSLLHLSHCERVEATHEFEVLIIFTALICRPRVIFGCSRLPHRLTEFHHLRACAKKMLQEESVWRTCGKGNKTNTSNRDIDNKPYGIADLRSSTRSLLRKHWSTFSNHHE